MMPCDPPRPVACTCPDADTPLDTDVTRDADTPAPMTGPDPDGRAAADREVAPTTEPSSSVIVLGVDHEAPGATFTAPVGDGAALGIARGWRPKPYAYVDPNEDAVAAVIGEHAQMLVVADGHNGRRASHDAVRAVVDLLGGGPHRPELGVEGLVDVVASVDDRVSAVPAAGRVRSRTTLVVALRSRSVLQWVSVGDSALLAVTAERSHLLSRPTRWFVGDGLGRDAILRTLPAGTVDLPASAAVLLATDGWTDYLPRGMTPQAAAAAAVSGADGPETAVRAVLSQAREGGAGDNVGVVVSGPWYKPRDADDHILDPDG